MRCRRLLWVASCTLLLTSAAHATTTTIAHATITVFSAITFSPTALAFGNQQIGNPATKVITVTNGGTTTFNFGVSLTSGPNSSEFSISNGCGGSLAANAPPCQISVTFSPTVAGSANAGVSLTGSGRTYTALLSGDGTTGPPTPTPSSIALSPSSIQIQDNATGGSIVSRATVTMSDGSTASNCTLSTSDTSYYTISGMNVVLAHGLSQADDGQHNTVISVVSCP